MSVRCEVLSTHVFLVREFLSAQVCEGLIEQAEAHGFGEAPVNTLLGPKMMKHVRNNERVMIDDEPKSLSLWDALSLHLPEPWQRLMFHRGGVPAHMAASGLNERLRFYRYQPGHRFRVHRDGHFVRPDGEEMSLLTALFFLNEDFEGGHTAIIEPAHATDITPCTGDVLLFEHSLLHEGREVTAGTKYVMRSDVMYRFL